MGGVDSRRTATGRGVPRPSLVGGSLVESLRRHLLVLVAVVLGLGATAVAALVLGFVDLSGSPSRLPDRHDGQAWYLHQTPPPQLVDLPDSPLLPDPPHDGGDRAADTLALMTAINARLESWIRERPDQWLWLHNRWPE